MSCFQTESGAVHLSQPAVLFVVIALGSTLVAKCMTVCSIWQAEVFKKRKLQREGKKPDGFYCDNSLH